MQTGIEYARYSSSNQREESIEAQLFEIKKYADQHGIQIIRTYTDEAESGRTDDRPGFLRMMQDIKTGTIKPDFLLLHKIDRFARDRIDSAFHKYYIKRAGIKIVYVAQQFGDNPEGRLMEGIMESFAQYHSENLAGETMKGLMVNARAALHTGGLPPLGFDVAPDKSLVINENEAAVVRKIFQLYLEGYGYKSIAQELNAAGYRSKKGKPFVHYAIHEILRNEKYMGTFVFNRRKARDPLGKCNHHANKNEDEIVRVPGALPVIITEDAFTQAREKMKLRKRGPLMGKKNTYLLTGLVVCGECGGPYCGTSFIGGRNKSRYYVYTCSRKSNGGECTNKYVHQDKLESLVKDQLLLKVFSNMAIDEISSKMFDMARDKANSFGGELKAIRERIREVNGRIDRLFDAIEKGVADLSMTKERMQKHKDELAQLKESESFMRITSYEWMTKENIRSFLFTKKDALIKGDQATVRGILETFTEGIVITPDLIHIEFIVNLDGGKVGCGGRI